MSTLLHHFLVGGGFGFVGGFLKDLHGWSQNPGPYDWGLASRRWIWGIAQGAFAGVGIASVS